MNGLLLYGDVVWNAELGRYHSWWVKPERLLNESPNSVTEIASTAAATTWYIGIDLQTAQSFDAWAVVGHNADTCGANRITLRVGTADNGTTFDQDVDSAYFNQGDFEPNFVGTFSAVSKRYWELAVLGIGAGENLRLGGFCLGHHYEFPVIPSAPYPTRHRDHVEADETMGAGESVRVAGGIFQDKTLVWRMASSALKTQLEAINKAHDGAVHPVCFVDHNTPDPNPYGCRYMSIEGLRSRQLDMDSRFDITLHLEDLT